MITTHNARRAAYAVAVLLGLFVSGCGGSHHQAATGTTATVRTVTVTATGTAAGTGAGTGASATATGPAAGGTPTTATVTLPSKHRQIVVLDAALKRMRSVYAALYDRATPGPEDVADYGVGALWQRGIDGAGTTVALLEGWNDPDVTRVIDEFDSYYRLPAPSISTIYPAGALPRTCPHGMVILGDYGSCRGWANELELDVESVHLLAPYARILLVATPADTETTADAAQNVAPPEMMKAAEAISASHEANVISVSDGTGESSYSHGNPEITAQDPGELAAAAAGIPFVVATGDCGVVQQLPREGQTCEFTTHSRGAGTWDDSPWVTAVGGSVPNLRPRVPARRGADHLWHPHAPFANSSASAGVSRLFARPSYQNAVAPITHSDKRSVPDITMDATEGTSEAAPLFAGVLALATQENGGKDLGPINPALYALGPHGAADGIADVIGGNDSLETPSGRKVLVLGYTATRGFDVASGWGTVNAARFVPSLVTETQRLDAEASARRSAQASLTTLETRSLSVELLKSGFSSDAGAGVQRLQIRASGLLPGYPVTLGIAGRPVARLRVNGVGRINTAIEVRGRGLRSGAAVRLNSLLIAETARLGS
jgi:hypothetical protein